MIKTDSNGDTLWTRAYGRGSLGLGFDMKQTIDGGYVLAGGIRPSGESRHAGYVVKTDENGDSLWTRINRGEGDCFFWSNAIYQTSDTGYIVVGGNNCNDYTADMYVVKVDASGDTMWTRFYGGPRVENAEGVEQTEDGGYAIFGHTLSYGAGWADFYLVKTDSFGETLWTRTYGGSNTDFGLSFQRTSDGGYVMVGWTVSFGALGWDIYVVKTGPDLSTASNPSPLPEALALYQNYPNPFNASTRITFDLPKAGFVTIKVFDVLGRKVATLMNGVREAGHHSIRFDGSGLPSGIYFYRLETGGMHEVKKMVMLK